MPHEMAATCSRNGVVRMISRVFIQDTQSWSATQAPVIDAVRGPPPAWITSQSMVIWRSPSASRSVTARRLRPISRWISTVRPPCLPAVASRRLRSIVARGSMPYSGVIPPRAARRKAVSGGDPAARLALEPGRQPILERRRHQHMGIAELHEARAFRIFHDAALQRNGAQFVGLAAVRSHRRVLPAAIGTIASRAPAFRACFDDVESL